MTLRRFLFRTAIIVLSCVAFSACGIIANQPADRVLVRTAGKPIPYQGSAAIFAPAQAYADLYLDYALIARQAYLPEIYHDFSSGRYRKSKEYNLDGEKYCKEAARDTDKDCMDSENLKTYAGKRLDQWRLIYASGADPSCRRSKTACAQRLSDVGVQIWVRRGKICSEAVVAFRGTRGSNFGDWHSNLTWITGLWPTYDIYKQVQDNTYKYFNIIKNDGCAVTGKTKIVAVGHSLGGGLAQQSAFRGGIEMNEAASKEGVFDKVVAFDPSPVTGYYKINYRDRTFNSKGLPIQWVYEDGEFLAYIRFLFRQIVPHRPATLRSSR